MSVFEIIMIFGLGIEAVGLVYLWAVEIAWDIMEKRERKNEQKKSIQLHE